MPPQLQGLAGPAAGALRNAAVQGTELALERPRVQNLWAQANRAADQTFINVVNGGKGAVSTNGGAVTLNLGAILEDVAARLGLPSGLSSKLPPNVANLTVFKAAPAEDRPEHRQGDQGPRALAHDPLSRCCTPSRLCSPPATGAAR